MSLLYGITRPLGYSGSTPPSEHCPECGSCNKPIGHCAVWDCVEPYGPDEFCGCLCWRCRHHEALICAEPEEHELCGWHLEEAKQAAADYWNDRKQDR